jgi:hypothetical protein
MLASHRPGVDNVDGAVPGDRDASQARVGLYQLPAPLSRRHAVRAARAARPARAARSARSAAWRASTAGREQKDTVEHPRCRHHGGDRITDRSAFSAQLKRGRVQEKWRIPGLAAKPADSVLAISSARGVILRTHDPVRFTDLLSRSPSTQAPKSSGFCNCPRATRLLNQRNQPPNIVYTHILNRGTAGVRSPLDR